MTHVLCDWYEDVSSWPIVSVTVPIQKNKYAFMFIYICKFKVVHRLVLLLILSSCSHDCALYMLSFMVSYAVTREIVNFTEV